jgi:fumarylpyruvate hydrolase
LEELGGDVQNLDFQLEKNGEIVQSGSTSEMLFSVDELISHVSRICTLKTGDLLFTGTPAGVGPVASGDNLRGLLCDRPQFSINVL